MSYHTGFGMPSISKTIKNLMLVILGLYLLKFVAGQDAYMQLLKIGGLFPNAVLSKAMIWQPFTYMFLHVSVWNMLVNLLVLWMFGGEVEAVLGERKFLIYYLTCGLSAAVAHMLLVPDSTIPMLGSAGCVFGILIAFGALFPERVITLLLFLVIPISVKAKYMVAAFIGLELLMIMEGTSLQIRELAPLFGLVGGYIFLWQLGFVSIRFFSMLRNKMRLRRKRNNIINADFSYQDSNNSYNGAEKVIKKIKKTTSVMKSKTENKEINRDVFISQEIDPILDKISREGIHSLSEEEKMKLDKAKHLIK